MRPSLGELNRTGWLAAGLLILLIGGVLAAWRWRPAPSPLSCPPEDVRWQDGGTTLIAVCAPGAPEGPVPVGQALTLGLRIDLNRATEAELTLLPGIGPSLARALVEARDRHGGFADWDAVDEVRGVGPAKLETLKQAAELRP